MASRLMSAYGNLASARTDIGRSLSDITGIGIEMEYGPEGRIAGQMAQSRIQRQTEAIGLGLESIQQIAGMGVEAEKEAERASEVGGEEVYKTKTPEVKTGYTTEGSMWQKMGRYLGFSEREYDIGGSRYTSSQIETALPYHRAGKSWEDISKFIGGGAKIGVVGAAGATVSASTVTGGTAGTSQPDTHYKESIIRDGREQTVAPDIPRSKNMIPETLTEAIGDRTKWQSYINEAMVSGDWAQSKINWGKLRGGTL